jgi:hypothetical protein
MPKTFSMDLRERVVAWVETGKLSRRQAAARFGVGVIWPSSTGDTARSGWRCYLVIL